MPKDHPLDLVPFENRRYEDIPVDKVKVINSRDREEEQFALNVESIETVGLLKPIRVNDRFLQSTGLYETRPATEADLESVTSSLQRLDPIWEVLYPEEQRRVLELLVERIDVGSTTVDVQFRGDGVEQIVTELEPIGERNGRAGTQ